MSNQISLTIPNDDPIALRAFGNALEEMAVAHGASLRMRTSIDLSMFKHQTGAIRQLEGTEAAQAVQGEQCGEFVPFTDDDVTPPMQSCTGSDTIDADGLPWDARIHSGNQERNADNTWRARRKPKDVTPEQWAEQVAQVREELFALMAIPVVPAADEVPTAIAEIVTVSDHPVVVEQSPGGLSLGFNIQCEPLPPVTDESPAAVFGAPATVEVPPAPPIADPVPPAPPVVAAAPVPPAPAPLPPVTNTGVPATLAELMTWLTSKAPADEAGRAARLEQINGVVARHGLVTLGQLQKRLDLIPQVHADLVKELGQ